MKSLEKLESFGLTGTMADTRRDEFNVKNGVLFANEISPDLLFIGDSITQMWELNAYFNSFGLVVNRGIGGDMAQIVAKRLQADCLQLKPRICVCMVGVNNMWSMSIDEANNIATEEAITNIVTGAWESIINQCKQAQQTLISCAILPLDRPALNCNQQHKLLIPRINKKLEQICEKNKVPFVNWHGNFTTGDGVTIRPGITLDGIHPLAPMYNEMATILKPYLVKVLQGQGL